MTKENIKINPTDYHYNQDTKVEIPGGFLLELLALSETLLQKEIKAESKFKYNYIDNSDKVVKKFKQEDVESGKLKKIVDWERTIDDPTIEYSITSDGILYANLKKFLESLHYDNIKNGIAISTIKSEDSVK
ncbi:MAG: hypothetical protein LBM02_10005 [Lachnospiraceae bacterium]|jgi:hypothetical protein|nr:hypothetical protein [Lachnospiraceae bacterium]